jgi:TonB dependent receptor
LGYNRIDFQFRDAFNPPADFGPFRSDSDEQRLFLNYYWNMSLPEFYRVATTWTLGIEAQGEKLNQRSTFDTTTDSVEPSRSQQGYYTQLLFNWRKQATLLAGVRMEDSSTFGVDLVKLRLAQEAGLTKAARKSLRGGCIGDTMGVLIIERAWNADDQSHRWP